MSSNHPLPSKNEREIFIRALEIPTADGRADFLNQVCGGNESLRISVEALLSNHKPVVTSVNVSNVEVAGEKIGDAINRYKLIEKLGEGGCGVVYRAEQQGAVALQVAFKLVKPGMNSRQVLRLFDVERKALADLNHSSIAKILDSGTTNTGRPYFVMELVRGQKITKYADQHRLTISERLELFVKVCRAVQHAHEKGIIHRDLKPSNVLVNNECGEHWPKIIDFGVAKATGGNGSTNFGTKTGQVIGTPAYMSPEQAVGKKIDFRTDIYSLGVLLYELILDCLPIETSGLSQYEQFHAIIGVIPQLPSSKIKHLKKRRHIARFAQCLQTRPESLSEIVQGALDQTIMKCLEKDPDRRFETVGDLISSIQTCLEIQIKHAPHSPNWPAKRVEKNGDRKRGGNGQNGVKDDDSLNILRSDHIKKYPFRCLFAIIAVALIYSLLPAFLVAVLYWFIWGAFVFPFFICWLVLPFFGIAFYIFQLNKPEEMAGE